jgi:RNA polymerase sigma factor (sigma-70 family)
MNALDRKVSWRVPPEKLIQRTLLGDSLARGALIELIYRAGLKALRNFDEETRYSAILAVTDRLLSYGMLGLTLAVKFDSHSSSFISWISAVLKNAAKDEIKKRRIVTVPDSNLVEDDDGEREQSILPGDLSNEPSRQYEAKQLLTSSSVVLNARERAVLRCAAEGDSIQEIAKVTGLSESRVRGVIAKARAKATKI